MDVVALPSDLESSLQDPKNIHSIFINPRSTMKIPLAPLVIGKDSLFVGNEETGVGAKEAFTDKRFWGAIAVGTLSGSGSVAGVRLGQSGLGKNAETSGTYTEIPYKAMTSLEMKGMLKKTIELSYTDNGTPKLLKFCVMNGIMYDAKGMKDLFSLLKSKVNIK